MRKVVFLDPVDYISGKVSPAHTRTIYKHVRATDRRFTSVRMDEEDKPATEAQVAQQAKFSQWLSPRANGCRTHPKCSKICLAFKNRNSTKHCTAMFSAKSGSPIMANPQILNIKNNVGAWFCL